MLISLKKKYVIESRMQMSNSIDNMQVHREALKYTQTNYSVFGMCV